MKNKKFISSIVLAVIIIICAILSIVIDNNSINNEVNSNLNNTINIETSDNIFRVYYFNVGNADCTLLQFNNFTMLIDGGNEADVKFIIEYLKNELGITKLDYVIATHSDDDHIGGLDKVIDNFELGTFYMPIVEVNQEPNKDKELKELIAAVINKGIVEIPNINDTFTFGDVEFIVKWIADSTIVSSNKSSIVLEAIYGETRFLFMGDYEEATDKELEKLGGEYKRPIFSEVDVLKVAHHRLRI